MLSEEDKKRADVLRYVLLDGNGTVNNDECSDVFELFPKLFKEIEGLENIIKAPISPAPDPAAALFALAAYARRHKVLATFHCSGMLDGAWTCFVGPEPDLLPIYKDASEAICSAILAAEKARQ